MAEYAVQQVVATSCTELLVAFRLSFPSPVWEVTAIQKTVLVDRAGLTLGSALLQGRLRASYTVAVPPQTSPLPPPIGTPLPPDGPTTVLTAPLQGIWAERPFAVAIPVPEAEPQMDLTVTAAHVADQTVHPALFNPAGLFLAVDDQSLIHLAVRVTRQAELHISEPSAGAKPSKPLPPIAPMPPKRTAFTRFQSQSPR